MDEDIVRVKAKVTLIGVHFAGKTSLIRRIVSDTFQDVEEMTVGAMISKHVVRKDDGPYMKFTIWDTAGQERYRALVHTYYRDSAVVLVVYDITQAETFVEAEKLIDEIRENAGPDTRIILVGNKSDLITERAVPQTVARELGERKRVKFIETSAKTSEGVEDLIWLMYDEALLFPGTLAAKDTDNEFELDEQKKSFCC